MNYSGRETELYRLWLSETNEGWTQEQRESLNAEEIFLVETWDNKCEEGLLRLCKKIKNKK